MGTRNLIVAAFRIRYNDKATTWWHQNMSRVSQLQVTDVILHLKVQVTSYWQESSPIYSTHYSPIKADGHFVALVLLNWKCVRTGGRSLSSSPISSPCTSGPIVTFGHQQTCDHSRRGNQHSVVLLLLIVVSGARSSTSISATATARSCWWRAIRLIRRIRPDHAAQVETLNGNMGD